MNGDVSSPRVSVELMNSLLSVQHDQPCWKVTKVLGSMLAFDFGDRRTVRARCGDVEIGSSILSIRNVFWRFSAHGGILVDSDGFNEDRLADLSDAVRGSHLEECSRVRGWLTIGFSNGSRIQLDLGNRHEAEADEEIAELALAAGLIVRVSRDGCFALDVPASGRQQQMSAAA